MVCLRFRNAALLLLMCCPVHSALALDVSRPEVQKFIDTMVTEYDYDRSQLKSALEEAQTQESILEAISKPAEKTLEWHEYRAIFLTKERINAGVEFWRAHRDALERISDETGVSPQVLVGVIGVETYFGRITGGYRVLDALATLAFDYPARADFFRKELRQFFLLVREEGIDATAATGSYAGAMGGPQFMPSSFRAYAVDSSNDGKRDIWGNWEDILGSVANYFVANGWQHGSPVAAQASLGPEWHGKLPENSLSPQDTVGSLSREGVLFATELAPDQESQLLTLKGEKCDEYWVGFHNFFVITRYNRSVMYALAVHQLGQQIALREKNRTASQKQ